MADTMKAIVEDPGKWQEKAWISLDNGRIPDIVRNMSGYIYVLDRHENGLPVYRTTTSGNVWRREEDK